jgi:putative FmdB family regulatory protein
MPLYEYDCHTHGTFEAVRVLTEAAQPEPCPTCHEHAPRILSAPRLAQVSRSDRIARDRNEKSGHEPLVVRKEQPARAHEGHERPALQRSPHSRPWALEHS